MDDECNQQSEMMLWIMQSEKNTTLSYVRNMTVQKAWYINSVVCVSINDFIL